MVLSLDALFGLPRKKAAGKSFRDAIHGHLLFGNQSLVDEFVASVKSKHDKTSKVCTCILCEEDVSIHALIISLCW